jgi:hypothetical protein
MKLWMEEVEKKEAEDKPRCPICGSKATALMRGSDALGRKMAFLGCTDCHNVSPSILVHAFGLDYPLTTKLMKLWLEKEKEKTCG